jgi:magnesium chelatase subunit D
MDTSPQPQAAAQMLAREMGAAYVPLPHAGAQMLSQVVRAAMAPSQR